jgi:hypothetical protein
MRELLLTIENGSKSRKWRAFCATAAQPQVVDERGLAVGLDDCPGLATLVAAVEQWRGPAHASELSLALGGEMRILRGEG